MSLMEFSLNLITSLVAQVAEERRRSLPAANSNVKQRLSHKENPHFLALISPHRKKYSAQHKDALHAVSLEKRGENMQEERRPDIYARHVKYHFVWG
ncbi:hypothetical protein PoB_001481000 [Plakobranchus ocellatus]|uniref:Uncharacterized protein n=1 Tax=Plakobranchus ocellatus TaxID=259542 RepID=A0AAV3YZD4_9GAST|nr:hypothetical protein PoB_001481000 [Plakobranchus ocellatus]